ncbi:MAG TPA: TIGR03915 family putative DNA repair protein [Candidatus Choladousia intestinigallinarum]|nr:TIGR03915 family putative DNA repair protein [Candidatus Choladousia intestinigallinarum]
MVIFECEDHPEGIFTGIYDAWDSRVGHGCLALRIAGQGNLELFASYRSVAADPEKAQKVARTIRRRMGEDAYQSIYQAALSCRPEKADCIYRVLVQALSPGVKDYTARRILWKLQDPNVAQVFEMARRVGNEAHRYLGFVRFRELAGGILFSEIQAENQVLPLLGDHFSDRLPGENFMIYDSGRGDSLLHRAHYPWALLRNTSPDREAAWAVTEQEAHFRKMWKGFCRSISVADRENPALQRQLWPLRFRNWMTEGQDF